MHADETPAGRLRLALRLHDFGVAMYRQRILRDHPEWPVGQVDATVVGGLAVSARAEPRFTRDVDMRWRSPRTTRLNNW